MGFLLVLLEALLWCDWQGAMLSIGVIGAGWAATDLVARLGSAQGAAALKWTAPTGSSGQIRGYVVTPLSVAGAYGDVAASAGAGSATISWSAPTSDGASPICGYVVTVWTNNGRRWSSR